MKGLKELKQTPVSMTVKLKVSAVNNLARWQERNYQAYTAEIIKSEKHGEVLVIVYYIGKDKKKSEHLARLDISERHFLTQAGGIASERFDSEGNAKAGLFIVSTSGINGWDWASKVSDMKHEWDRASEDIPINGAGKVILRFAERYKLREAVQNTAHVYKSGLCWFAAYQMKIKDEKREAAQDRLEDRTIKRMRQVSEDVPEDFRQWIEEEILTEAAWFYKFEKRVAKGTCAACGESASIHGVKNNKKGTCHACGRPIRYLNISRIAKGLKTGFNAAVIVKANDTEYVSRYYTVTKWYDNCCGKISLNTTFFEYAREFWQGTDGGIKTTGLYKNSQWTQWKTSKWERIAPRFGVSTPGMIYPGNAIEVTREVARQMNAPRLENIDIRPLFENNTDHTPAKIFCGVYRMPSIESMGKMGLLKIAYDLINNREVTPIDTGSPAKQLRVDRLVLQKFAEINITRYQWNYWSKWKLTLNDWDGFVKFINSFNNKLYQLDGVITDVPNIKLDTLTRYLEKQSEVYGHKKDDTLMYWSDYVQMATLNGSDLTHNRDLLYPQNVKAEHDLLMIKKDELKNRKHENGIKSRVKLLKKLEFNDDDFIIAPLGSVAEFVNESRVLSHCVKTYISQCSEGRTNIFGLRKRDDPGTPYFTVNISNDGTLIQNRGKHNCDPPKDVKAFVGKWLKFIKKRLETMSLDPKCIITEITATEFREGA